MSLTSAIITMIIVIIFMGISFIIAAYLVIFIGVISDAVYYKIKKFIHRNIK